MNFSTAIFLINKDVRAVAVSYEKNGDGTGAAPFHTFKTFDQDLKIGDHVVIPTDTRHGMTVARVEAVDVEIDFDSAVQIKWLVDRVDTVAAQAIAAQEADAIARIKSAEARAARDKLAAKLLADNPDLAALPLSNVSALLPK